MAASEQVPVDATIETDSRKNLYPGETTVLLQVRP